jgi:hypothetical protein
MGFFLATAGLWLGSKLVDPRVLATFKVADGRVNGLLADGDFVFKIRSDRNAFAVNAPGHHGLLIVGAGYLHATWPNGRYEWWFVVPLLPLAIVFAIAPAAWARVQWKKRIEEGRLAEKRCPRCGYDLRATPERCPECGEVPPKKEIVSS